MKIFKYILLTVVFLGSEEIAFSQYYLKSVYDSLSLESDSVLLFFDEDHLKYYIDLRAAYPGTIDWQASSDLVNWRSLDKHNDSLDVRIDSSAYYRATYVEGTCNPVMSDTAFLIEKVTVTGSNEFTVDSLGGVFLLPSGIKVKIPRGAVGASKNTSKSESKEIKVEILDFNGANALAAINPDENISFLSGISISTDVFDFAKPIKIKIPVKNLDVTGLPLLYKLDTISGRWILSKETLIVIPKDEFVEIVLNCAEQESDITLSKSKEQIDIEKLIFILNNHGGVMTDYLCRLNGFTSKTADYDFQSSGGCAVSRTENKIVYHECGSREESYSATEISSSCEPKLNVPGGCIKIIKDEPGQIQLSTTIGGLPLPYQTINVNTSNNLSAPNNTVTISDGTIFLPVTGNEVGDGLISLSVPFDYYLSTIKATGAGGNESNSYTDVQKNGNGSVCIKVIDVPEVTTAPVSNITCNTAIVGGIVTKDNFDTVTERGVIVNGRKYRSGSGLGQFSINLTSLDCFSKYSVQAYAHNDAGDGYGAVISIDRPDDIDCKCASVTSIPSDSPCETGEVTTIVGSTFVILERGIYYGKSPGPDKTGTKLQSGSGEGTFTVKPPDLEFFTTYYVKGYAITTENTYYGNEVSFKTAGPVTDIEGNIYNTILIGDQYWMSENLATKKLNDGTTLVHLDSVWRPILVPGIIEEAYKTKPLYPHCGCFYNAAAVESEKLCPVGWHVPTHEDFEEMIKFLETHGYNYDGDTVYHVDNFFIHPVTKDTTWRNGLAKSLTTGTWRYSDERGSPGSGDLNTTCFSVYPCGAICSNTHEKYDFRYGDIAFLMQITNTIHYNLPRDIRFDYPGIMDNGWIFEAFVGGNVRCVKDSENKKGLDKEIAPVIKSDNINTNSVLDMMIIPTKDKEIKLRQLIEIK